MTAAMNEPETRLLAADREALDRWFDERFETKMTEREAAKTPSLSIIATKGTMDMAYPPFILSSTASALGWDVSVFFTFYGLDLLRKDLHLGISPLGNPAMPMKMPFGPKWLRGLNWNIPNVISTNIPGFETFATAMMEKTVRDKGVASIAELREVCIEAGVKLYACQMTVDLFGYTPEDFIPEVAGWIGAASFLPESQKADVSLFI
jgi:peroxiredoxin family protein